MLKFNQVLRFPKITCPQFGQSPNCKLSAKRTAVLRSPILKSRYLSALFIFALIFSLSVCSSPSGGGKPALTGTVSITNMSPEVGDTLTASYADGNGTGTPTWQWFAGDDPIEDANSAAYTVAASDLGKTLTARVSFADQDGTITSEPTAVVAETAKPTLTGTVTIIDTTPEVGDTLTAEYADGNGTGDRAWQWLADDVAIDGTNSDTYTVTASELDKTLAARVSFANQSGSVSSEPTAPVTETTKPALTGTVIIDKTSPKVGDTLTAEYSPGNGSGDPTWQWLMDGSIITGANSNTYEVADSTLGKKLVVRVSYANQSGSVSSEPTAAVAASSFTVTFNSNGGSVVQKQVILPGETAEEPAKPTKDGLYFDGWYLDDETFKNRWIFADPINSNLTLYAQWSDIFVAYTIDDVSEFLGTQTGTKDTPASMKVKINLGLPSAESSGWRNLLTALATAGDYVALDLSACTMTGNSFDPNNDYHEVPGTDQITRIAFPDVVTSVGDWAFYGCASLTEVSIPKVTSIGDFAFQSCSSLTEVSFPEVTSIGDAAFRYCGSLTEVSIPEATNIGNEAFHSCASLTEVSFPEVKSIGNYAFVRCYSLTEVSVPKVKSIGDFAFHYCTSLTVVSVPEATSIGDAAFFTCSSLTEVSVPEAKSIGEGAFAECTSLTEASFPQAISIGRLTFDHCILLKEVSIPKATNIDHNAFFRCDSLRTITLGATAPTVGSSIFYTGSGNPEVTVKIPVGATGYDVPGTVFPKNYNETGTYTPNWANGFRGKGWDGSAFTNIGEETPVTLRIEYQ